MAISSVYLNLLKNISLILVSLLFLPLSTFILFLSYVRHPWLFLSYDAAHVLPTGPYNVPTDKLPQQQNGNGHSHAQRRAIRSSHPSTAVNRTILVTGVGMSKGLHIARAFHLSRHRVIGADCTPHDLIPSIGHFSRAIDKFYTLPSPIDDDSSYEYIRALANIVQRENVALWVSCSGVASALDDARAKELISLHTPSCACIQFDIQTTQLLHEKNTFTAHAASLGLPVPETHTVTTRAAVHKVLGESPRTKKQYVMKSINMDDASRGEINTLLPRRTLSETYNHLARMPISEKNPWVLQQYVPGNREYCTHALVVRGEVKVFVACPSSELLMHYKALPHPQDPLSRAMLRFTEEFARKCQQDKPSASDFTGHLSFDFLIEEQVTERGVENVLRAIECNPRAHTAVTLFRGLASEEMVQAYLSALESEPSHNEARAITANGTNGMNGLHGHPDPFSDPQPSPSNPITPSASSAQIYWLAHDIITLLFIPLLSLLLTPFLRTSPHSTTHSPSLPTTTTTFLTHLLHHHDGFYETWDPLPAWLAYHVYWPGVLLTRCFPGGRWSRANVSTGKVFGC